MGGLYWKLGRARDRFRLRRIDLERTLHNTLSKTLASCERNSGALTMPTLKWALPKLATTGKSAETTGLSATSKLKTEKGDAHIVGNHGHGVNVDSKHQFDVGAAPSAFPAKDSAKVNTNPFTPRRQSKPMLSCLSKDSRDWACGRVPDRGR